MDIGNGGRGGWPSPPGLAVGLPVLSGGSGCGGTAPGCGGRPAPPCDGTLAGCIGFGANDRRCGIVWPYSYPIDPAAAVPVRLSNRVMSGPSALAFPFAIDAAI